MVGIVVVSHSQCLAEGAVELAKMMARDARIAAAGGLEDGTPGTSFEKIMTAIESVYSEDGVAVLMDMGSAVMTTEMVIEALGYDNVFMLDGPVVEGAIVAALEASLGTPAKALQAKVDEVRTARKLDL
ncbi:dihydroxyacetone kinase phosphoryl donor subunit DhaM [Anaerovibrio sp.]|uniref:dihydroxyacetone kinase phosphoryl donor subunit DhaM n=1 Tax=Anaerovibrio sp. TaxID=1872532 RepID=UPI003F14DA6D